MTFNQEACVCPRFQFIEGELGIDRCCELLAEHGHRPSLRRGRRTAPALGDARGIEVLGTLSATASRAASAARASSSAPEPSTSIPATRSSTSSRLRRSTTRSASRTLPPRRSASSRPSARRRCATGSSRAACNGPCPRARRDLDARAAARRLYPLAQARALGGRRGLTRLVKRSRAPAPAPAGRTRPPSGDVAFGDVIGSRARCSPRRARRHRGLLRAAADPAAAAMAASVS